MKSKDIYIKEWIAELNTAFEHSERYKIRRNDIEETKPCICHCKNDKWYIFNSLLVCSNCFTEYKLMEQCYLLKYDE